MKAANTAKSTRLFVVQPAGFIIAVADVNSLGVVNERIIRFGIAVDFVGITVLFAFGTRLG